MESESELDCGKIGEIGHMSKGLEEEFTFWKCVVDLKMPFSEVERMTMGAMRRAAAYSQMKSDYKSVWNTLFRTERDKNE